MPFRVLEWVGSPPRARSPAAGSLAHAPHIQDNSAVPGPPPEEFGLDERTIAEIRARDESQARLFAELVFRGCLALWIVLSVLIYVHAAPRAPLLGLVLAPLVGLMGAVIGGLPIAVVGAILSWLRYPAHPLAGALERYEAATAGVRVCDVCRLARGDEGVKEGVSYCSRCGAWICPECRERYDLRAIAALRRARHTP